MSSLFLANELLDLIVGHLDPDSPADRRALLSCALVNNALRIMTRPRVFKRVKISYGTVYKKDVKTVFTDSKFATGAQFLNIITTNPLIAGLVKELVIEVVLLGISGSIDICSDDKMFSLYRITHQLAKLQKFSIASSSDIFLWEDTEKTTQLFLYEIASRVRSLDVTIFKEFPLSAFLNAKKLRSLRVQNMKWNIMGSRQYTNLKVELESLDIGYGWRFLDIGIKKCLTSPSTPLDLSRLRSLTFSCDISQEVNDVLGLCSASLEELSLQCMLPMPNPSLYSFNRLRLLMIQSNEAQIWFVATILKTLPHNRQNHQPADALTIILGFVLGYTSSDFYSVPLLPWKDLTDTLFHLNMTGHLKRVKLVFTGSSTIQRMDSADVTRILDRNKGLRDLRHRGIITYEAY